MIVIIRNHLLLALNKKIKTSYEKFGILMWGSYIYPYKNKIRVMKKIPKSILTAEWLTIKSMYESNTNGSNKYDTNFPINGELDQLTLNFIDKIGEITSKLGCECVIDDVPMDLWKERIWSLIENAGLLQDIAWKVDLEDEETEIKDNWYSGDDEDFDADLEAQSYEVFGLNKI